MRRAVLLLTALAFLAVACGSGAPSHPLVYVALGASDAAGVGVSDYERDAWVPKLARRLPPGSRVLNLGISGSTLNAALRDQLPVALDAHPDLVTVWLVVNDYLGGVTLTEYERALAALLAGLSQDRSTRVFVGNLPDLGRPAPSGERVADWNATIERLVIAYGAALVDLNADFQALTDRSDLLSSDGFHPNARGYSLLAEAFWRRMEVDGGR